MSAWVLPDHLSDVLPSEARRIEELRRGLLDCAQGYGYELVIPPLLEHLESLLSGTGETLDLQTFKLVDQISGRSLGLRADTTPQVARIDAHLLNRRGVARLCYCGPVLHTRPERARATREPLQFGAEIFGHEGLEADLEILSLALDCLHRAGVQDITVDLSDVRMAYGLLEGVAAPPKLLAQVHGALMSKDASELHALTQGMPDFSRDGLRALVNLYGDAEVLDRARSSFGAHAGICEALDNLAWLGSHLHGVKLSYDLADMRGYSYYSGIRFSIYAQGMSDALARGGRYDKVGAVFGRNRPAAGFSFDVKMLSSNLPALAPRAAVRAPWGESPGLAQAIGALRAKGQTVVCALPGHESENQEFQCDRELVLAAGAWTLKELKNEMKH